MTRYSPISQNDDSDNNDFGYTRARTFTRRGSFDIFINKRSYNPFCYIFRVVKLFYDFLFMGRAKQFRLLLWKNFVIQRRHPLAAAVQLTLPFILAMVLAITRLKADTISYNPYTSFRPFSLADCPLRPISETDNDQMRISFAPANSLTASIIRQTLALFTQPLAAKGFKTETDLVNFYTQNETDGRDIGGIVFMNGISSVEDLNGNISYKIRIPQKPQTNMLSPPNKFFTTLTYPPMQTAGPRSTDNTGGEPGYCSKGFLPLQHAVAMAIGAVINQTESEINLKEISVKFRRFPYPPYMTDYLGLALKEFLPLIIMLSFLYPAFDLVKSLVLEKEKKLKESMKIMGLTGFLHWASWFTKAFIFFIIDVILVTFLLTFNFGRLAVLINSDASLIFVFLVLYIISGISFCLMISTFFSTANSAATAGGIIWFLSYMPYFFIGPKYSIISFPVKMLSSLLCNTCMAFGGMQIFLNENAGYGLIWSRVNTPTSPDDPLTMAIVMVMLVVDTILYLLITWYVDNVFPGEFGMPQSWYFPFQASYWCPHRLDKIQTDLPQSQVNPEYFEEEPSGLTPGISICGVTKVYGPKIAVNNLNLNIYNGQITALLGHNGAGKTTTMSMLTGLFPPSRGTAFINGHNIVKDAARVRSSLGLCPQHDVIFDDLTVAEHFYFSCQLKDVDRNRIQAEIDEMLLATNLIDKRDTLSAKLSGGMKRRLCVGMALVGDSKVVLLDEPTSGMDPTSRRFTWDLLQSQSKNRTILLSTHFMDEADILGDRIAIMAQGELQCCGSPMFLKKKYGAGYHMVIVKKLNCNPEPIKQLVHSIIPKAEVESNIGAELSFILPHKSSSKFPELFGEIEKHKKQLDICSYGASVTTMEEVFLKVGEAHDSTLKAKLHGGNEIAKGNEYHKLHNGHSDESLNGHVSTIDVNVSKHRIDYRNKGATLIRQQIKAMLIKKVLHTKRNWLLTLVQLVVPVVVLIICLIVIKNKATPIQEPPLVLDLTPFGETHVPYAYEGNKAGSLANVFDKEFDFSADHPLLVNDAGPQADITQFLLGVANNSTYTYNTRYMIGGSFYEIDTTNKKMEALVLFNNQPYHTPAIALRFMDEALLRYATGNNNLRLTVINHPLPELFSQQVYGQKTQKKGMKVSNSVSGLMGMAGHQPAMRLPSQQEMMQGYMISFQISFNMMFGISFLASSFLIFLVKERATDAKHLQFVSGVRAPTFWIANFIWDFFNYMIPCLLMMLVFIAFQQDGFCTLKLQGCLLLIFVMYGWCVLPFTYLLSFMFTVASSAYARVTMFNIFSGVVSLIVISILFMINDRTREVKVILDWIFMAMPNYCLGAAIKDLYINFYNKKFCDSYPQLAMICTCSDWYCFQNQNNMLAWAAPGIGREVFFMALWGVVYFLLLMVMELGLGIRLTGFLFNLYWSGRTAKLMSVHPKDLDEDVVKENERINATNLENLFITENLVVKNLAKFYGLRKPFLAVEHVSVGVPRGECFGLLGINGAGKTTTFKMLTGDEAVSTGDAFVEGFSIRSEITSVRKRLGYCPQFDAIIDQMSGRETLFMFGRLRGIPEKDLPDLVTRLSNDLLFAEHVDKLVKNYSGGNKRKLSTAVALIGNPPIVFLDEPTTGMDPLARRMVWDTISKVRDSGCSIILTSHSMEECDALCTRLAIMVKGRFKCLGSPQHLKNKFGKGFTLTAKIQQNSLTAGHLEDITIRFQQFIANSFPGSVAKDQHVGMVQYHIPSSNMTWAETFAKLEKAKHQYHLEDYSLGQTTLEQVFLSFTRKQD